MEEKKYTYDAFISYRHTELDKFVAETLHKRMEAFKLPKNINRDVIKREKIERVFRDKDELPLASNLEDPIVAALEESEYLVVICSPRLKESMWCKKEIQTFIEMHGRRNILAVLIEGEPADSFPDELLYEERTTTDENGNVETVKVPIEPLAADFRGKDKKEIEKAMKTEILRLLAPMFGVSFDDLRQRHREQRIRKIITISSIAAIFGIAFGIYSTATAIRIQQQAELLAKQQAYTLADTALELYEKNDRLGGISTAYMALTEYQGVKMPKTPEAEAALAKCMSVYDGGATIRASYQVELDGILDEMKISPDGMLILVADNIGNINVVRVDDKSRALSISSESRIDRYDFIDNDNFFYLSVLGGLRKVNITTGEEIKYELPEYEAIWDAVISPDGSTIVIKRTKLYEFIDAKTFKQKSVYECEETVLAEDMLVDDKSDLFFVEAKVNDEGKLIAVESNTGKELYRMDMPEGSIIGCAFTDDTAYLLSYSSLSMITGRTTITSINKKDGSINYVGEYPSIFAREIILSNNGYILLVGDSQAVLVRTNTGEELDNFEFGEYVVKCDANENGNFLLYTSEGTSHVINPEGEFADLGLRGLVCSDLVQLERTSGSLVGRRENDNRLIMYSYFKNMDSYVYTEELAEAENEGLYSDAARSRAEELGIDKPQFVECLLEIEDANLVIVGYVDESFVTFRMDTMQMLKSYKETPAIDINYYGKINDYYVVTDSIYAYLLDEDGMIRAEIENMAGVSADKKSVVVYGKDDDRNDALIAIPVYTQQGLLDKAKRNIDMLNGNK